MSAPPEYDRWQQLYCLSAASGTVSYSSGTEAELQDAMDQALHKHLPDLPGGWTASWGPRVYKADKFDRLMGPDSVWFAAESASQRLCVVAVAGTSPKSLPDLNMDFDVANVVDFDAWTETWPALGVRPPSIAAPPLDPSGTYAAAGVCTGIYNVLSQPSNLASYGQTIGDYLRRSVPAGYDIVFTGHSMGGAVAPTCALGLLRAGLAGGNRVYILPTAGPTPGNAALAGELAWWFPPQAPPAPPNQFRAFNNDLFNINDAVPQAWSTDAGADRSLPGIAAIYGGAGPAWRRIVADVVALLAARATASGIAYAPMAGTAFAGPAVAPVASGRELEDTVLAQHLDAYWDFVGVLPWYDQFQDRLAEHPGVEPLLPSRRRTAAARSRLGAVDAWLREVGMSWRCLARWRATSAK
jgi:hypothetical protein